ncbi:MAG: methylated-DNA--[protein]-cysteine S-methyltransferase [Solirubrobacterales bacterium]|nr:methylated-DNA--[protein]-cysteine S-methyltransferase [Solirubrobacterales bacterium]
MPTVRHAIVPSPIGPLLLVADQEDRLCGLYTDGHLRGPATPPGRPDGGGVLEQAAQQLDGYFAGERTAFDVPLHADGSSLQLRVWAALQTVRYGTTTTYGALAAGLGLAPGTARAVGAANARNPLSIVVPCHRVVGVAGALTGYAGGLGAKRALLTLEGAILV